LKYVYMVQVNPPDGPVKIGYARDVYARISHIRSVSPFPVRLCAALPGDEDLESAVHRKFAHLRVRGEWFKWAPEVERWAEGANKISPIRATPETLRVALDVTSMAVRS
jgi:hypothetical protein